MQIFFPGLSGLGGPVEIRGLDVEWRSNLVAAAVKPLPLRSGHRDYKPETFVAWVDLVLIGSDRHDEVAQIGFERTDRASGVVEKPRRRHREPQVRQTRHVRVRRALGQKCAEIGVEGDDFLVGNAH